MSYFTLFKGSNSQYYFNLKAGNHEVVLSSEGYVSKQGCQSGIASVKSNAPIDSRYEKRTSISNKPYFVLKASNGEIIGTSQMYSSTYARDNGISVVKSEAPTATITDLT